MIDILEQTIETIPYINRVYKSKAAQLKRNYCLLLHRLGLLKPISFVQWLATYECNLFCPYCEASSGKAADNELTTEEVKWLINDLARMKVKRFLISGGEPLARPDIVEIMQYANQKKMLLGLVTNGYRVEEMWDELRCFNYFLYFTSIDGVPEYHDRVRGREGSFEKAVKGLELFGRLGVRTRMINTVVYPANINQLEELLKLIKGSAANLWHLTPAAQIGKAVNSYKYSLSGSQLKYIVAFIENNKHRMKIDLGSSHKYIGCFNGCQVGKPFFCGAGLTRCSIMPDGEVMGCQQVYDNFFSEGNIREKPFSYIWKKGFVRFRKKTFQESCKGCIFFHSCQGGCWAEMEKQKACLKKVWEDNGEFENIVQ